jgi:hypothetical protein
MSVNLAALAPLGADLGRGMKSPVIRNVTLEHSEPLEFDHPLVIMAVSSASADEQATPTVYVIRYLFSQQTK